MNKLGFVSFLRHCVVILFLCSVSFSLYSNEGDASSPDSPEETHNSSRDSKKDQQEGSKDLYRRPEPAKGLVESYVDRQKKKHKKHSRKPYHPGKENPFQPRPRIPESCTEEVRRNYQNCQDQQKKRSRFSRADRRKCQQYRKWFQTRCQAAHDIANSK